jgi:hypothetical protein
MKVENEVQLAHIAEVMIKNLNKQMNGLQVSQLIVCDIYAQAEVKSSIAPVDDLVGFKL